MYLFPLSINCNMSGPTLALLEANVNVPYDVYNYQEGACIVSGIAYNGKDENGNVLWDGCANMKLLVFFSATRTQHFIDGFHMTTNYWLLK